MTGKRLILGISVMGVAVPVILFLILELSTFNQLATISLVCMLGWAVAHLAGDILTMRRLGGRNNPVDALKQWEPHDESAFGPGPGETVKRGRDASSPTG